MPATHDDSSRPSRLEAIAALTAPGELYELATIDIAGAPCRTFVNAPISLRAMYEAGATDRPFIVYEDERLTFAETWATAARIAHCLRHDYGVAAGDRVAISMRNYPEWMTTFAAVTSLGAVSVAMNSMWSTEEMEYGLRDCGARVVIADRERVEQSRSFVGELELRVIGVRLPQGAPEPVLADLIAGLGDVPMPETTIAPDDPATIFYTSGSTGNAKGVVSSHRNILSALLSWELDARVSRRTAAQPPARAEGQTCALLGIPLFHVTGSHAVHLQSYRAQRKLVAMYKWDPEIAAELIERERVTIFLGPAALTGDLVRVARTTGHDLSSLLTVGGGGAPRAPEQVADIGSSFRRALPNTGWGMTETNAIGTGIGEHDYLDRPESSGRVSAVLDLRIIDDAGIPLPAGERGELLVRGTSVFPGYWNRSDVNAEVFVDGWFRTGDVAYLDDDGYLFIVDRIKDLIIRGGENIGCGRVEAALLLHPAVHEAAVYAVPDERMGEEVGATVYADADLEVDDLLTFVRDHLAAFEVPRFVRIATAPLPRTASGKIFKRALQADAVSVTP